MKIAKLTISNFLKIKDVEMNPSHTNVIVGKNKQGKTSILKAIKTAFSGDADSTSIRIGETKAEITVELEDLNIHRTITEKGTYLKVSNKEGFQVPSPQKYLDGILGTFSFNPVEFFELKPIERKKYLLNAIKMTLTQEQLAEFTGEKLDGIDYAAHALEVLEEARKYYYNKRTIANAEVEKKNKTVQELSAKLPEGFVAGDFNEARVKELRQAITDNEVSKSNKISKANFIESTINAIERLKKELEKEEANLNKYQAEHDAIILVDTANLEKELATLEGQRDLVYTAKKVDEVKTELTVSRAEADRLDAIVVKLSKEVPEALIAKAELPVAGLTIVGNDILVNGVSLDNLSSSEQLKFGLEIVRKLNDKFNIICIDGIESLDKETFEWFLKEVENDDYQYFVTRVKNNGETGILVEDGEIKETNVNNN